MANTAVPDSVFYNIAVLKYRRYVCYLQRHFYAHVLSDIHEQTRKDGRTTRNMRKMFVKFCDLMDFYDRSFRRYEWLIGEAERIRDVWIIGFREIPNAEIPEAED